VLTFDGHLDLSMNAVNWDRNLDLDVYEIREREAQMAEKGRACGTVTLPELRKAEMAVCLATVIDRTARPGSPPLARPVRKYPTPKPRTDGLLSGCLNTGQNTDYNRLADVTAISGLAAARGAANDGLYPEYGGCDPIVWPISASLVAQGMRVVGHSPYGVWAFALVRHTRGAYRLGSALLGEMDAAGMISI
jgi:membrane dipeptidase